MNTSLVLQRSHVLQTDAVMNLSVLKTLILNGHLPQTIIVVITISRLHQALGYE